MVEFDTTALVPDAWRALTMGGPVYAFNPAITLHQGHRLCAYRIVLADGRRRMALVRLDATWRPVPGTVVALSDVIVGAPPWQADPRFCGDGHRLWLHFNSGGAAPNVISVLELDPGTLQPIGSAMPLHTRGGRRPVEKNWMLFSEDGQMRAVYQIAPHVVVAFARTAHGWVATPFADVKWPAHQSSKAFGELRGGTPPVRVGDVYVSFFHGRRRRPGWERAVAQLMGGPAAPWEYTIGAYLFDARPPYTPRAISRRPLITARRARTLPALNSSAARVAYPCGAVHEDGQWVVSYGENDERCCVAHLSHANVIAGMRDIEAPA